MLSHLLLGCPSPVSAVSWCEPSNEAGTCTALPSAASNHLEAWLPLNMLGRKPLTLGLRVFIISSSNRQPPFWSEVKLYPPTSAKPINLLNSSQKKNLFSKWCKVQQCHPYSLGPDRWSVSRQKIFHTGCSCWQQRKTFPLIWRRNVRDLVSAIKPLESFLGWDAPANHPGRAGSIFHFRGRGGGGRWWAAWAGREWSRWEAGNSCVFKLEALGHGHSENMKIQAHRGFLKVLIPL